MKPPPGKERREHNTQRSRDHSRSNGSSLRIPLSWPLLLSGTVSPGAVLSPSPGRGIGGVLSWGGAASAPSGSRDSDERLAA